MAATSGEPHHRRGPSACLSHLHLGIHLVRAERASRSARGVRSPGHSSGRGTEDRRLHTGHRTTYGAPFRKLNNVKVGDEIFLILPYGVARYIVTRTVIVNPKDVEAVAQIGKEQVSLAACHPLTSARQRIVVQGDLVGFSLSEPSQGSTQP